MAQKVLKQGSDLIDLRLTWRDMENFIFEICIRFLETFLMNFGQI